MLTQRPWNRRSLIFALARAALQTRPSIIEINSRGDSLQLHHNVITLQNDLILRLLSKLTSQNLNIKGNTRLLWRDNDETSMALPTTSEEYRYFLENYTKEKIYVTFHLESR